MDVSYDEGYVHKCDVVQRDCKTDDGKTEKRDLAQLRVHFNRPTRNGDGEFTEKGDFWANVELWGPKARHLKVVQPGARVAVLGSFRGDNYTTEGGEERHGIKVVARSIAILPSSIQDVKFKAKVKDAETVTDED